MATCFPAIEPQQCGKFHRFPNLTATCFHPSGSDGVENCSSLYSSTMALHTSGTKREIVLCATRNPYDRLLYEFPVARKRRVTASLSPARIGGRLSMLLVIFGPPGPASRGTCPRPSACNSWNCHETPASVHPLTCHTARAGHAFATKVSPNTFCDVFLHGPPPIRLQGVRQLHTAHGNEVCPTASAVQQSVHDEGVPGGQIAASGVAREWVPSCQKNSRLVRYWALKAGFSTQTWQREGEFESNVTVFIPNGWIRCRREGAARAICLHQTDPGRQAPGVVHYRLGPLRGPWGGRRIAVRHPWAPQGPRQGFSRELAEKSCGACPATGRSPHMTPRVPPRAFYGLSTA